MRYRYAVVLMKSDRRRARDEMQKVIALAPKSPQADKARKHLQQLEKPESVTPQGKSGR